MADLPSPTAAFLQTVLSPVLWAGLGQCWALGTCSCLPHTHLLWAAGTFHVGTASAGQASGLMPLGAQIRPASFRF